MEQVHVRHLTLPLSVRGVTVPNGDDSFDVYINRRLSPEKQRSALEHELRHIRRDHFYVPLGVAETERDAEEE
jgi:hypothetical protein